MDGTANASWEDFAPLAPSDFAEVRSFYHEVINAGDNAAGWVCGVYPSDEMLRGALEAGELYAARANGGNLNSASSNDDEPCAARANGGELLAVVIANTSCNEGFEGAAWGVGCAPGEFLVPHALASSPAHRHEGWGRAAIRFVINMALELGMKAVRLDVFSGNVAAERLYLSEGFYFVGPSWMYYEDTGWAEYTLYELPLEEADGEGVGAFHPRSRIQQGYTGRTKAPTGSGPSGGYTPEMEELAYRITHPDGDPNTNFRRLGFGGSHLG